MTNIRKKRVLTYTNKMYAIFIFAATLFMGVGYASINSITMNINGEVFAKAQEGIFITKADLITSESVDADLSNTKINSIYQNVLNSTVALSDTNYDSNAMIEVTIYNSTDKVYLFDGVSYDSEFYSNSNIAFDVIDFDIGDKLLPGEYITLKLNFYYLDDKIAASSGENNLESYLKFNFSLEYFKWDSYVYNGFDKLNVIEATSETLKMQISPMSGAYDRLVIPVDNLEVGSYYTISFNEKKPLLKGSTYINDSSQFAYGTAVTIKSVDDTIGTNEESFIFPKYFNYDNDPLHTAFMWKEPFLEVDYVEGNTHNISLTFYASEETMYWMWDFANIRNSAEIEFTLSDIKIRKIEYPKSSPYVRFVDTTFNDWIYDVDYDDDGVDEEQNYLKYSYRTTATENELDLRIETGKGWEYFNVPIKNLSIGSTYKLSFDVDTTPTALTINTSNIYASLVQEQPFYLDKRILSSSDSLRKDVSFINKTGSYSGSIEFTATAESMYWVWQCGGINNYQWANIKISNVVLETLD